MFGFSLYESIAQYPKVVTAKELQRKLKISYNSASLLKRRVQLFAVNQMPKIKQLIEQKLRESAPKKDLPEGDVDLTKKLKDKTIVAVDTLALFSASQRANKGRARYRNSGISASVFLSDKLGGKQIGTIVQTIAVKGGGAIFQPVRDQTMNSLGSQIREFIPLSTIVFTDEGYPFLKGIYRNHRMINHSAKSKDKRYRWARNRWSKNGINNQVAEGNQSNLKSAFKAYSYFRPEYAPFYLSEYSMMSNIRAYGLEAIANVGRAGNGSVTSDKVGLTDGVEGALEKREKGVVGKVCRGYALRKTIVYPKVRHWLRTQIKTVCFSPVTLEERNRLKDSEGINQSPLSKEQIRSKNVLESINSEMERNDKLWQNKDQTPYFIRAREKRYSLIAENLWKLVKEQTGWFWLNDVIEHNNLNRSMCIRIIRKWISLGIVEASDYTNQFGNKVSLKIHIKLKLQTLPKLKYMITREEYVGRVKSWERKVRHQRIKTRNGSRKKYQ